MRPRTPTPAAAHLFQKNGRALLFDPCTSTSFALDAAGEVAAREMLGARPARNGVSRAELAAARRELHGLCSRGHFGEFQPPLVPLHPLRIGFPMPVISRACNLRCRYCFVNRAGPLHMSREVMQAIAVLTAKRALRDGMSSHTVWIGSVGEPTAYLPQYFEFRELLEAEGRKHGVTLTTGIGITNGTTTGDPAVCAWLDESQASGHAARVSLDGPPEAHDAIRVHADGRGTYADVLAGIAAMRQRGLDPGVSATLTASFPDVCGVYFQLLGLGFDDVVVNRVRARPEQPYYLGSALDAICAGYDRFAQRLLDLPEDKMAQALRAITKSAGVDYFARFILRVAGRHILTRRCEAWIERVVADTDGRLYGCESFLGVPEACIGSVWDGVDEARVQELYAALHISRRLPCKDCWARFLCGGGCMHQSYLTFGELFPPDPAECALNQHLIELAILFYAELKEKRPAVLAELQRSLPSGPTQQAEPSPKGPGEPAARPIARE